MGYIHSEIHSFGLIFQQQSSNCQQKSTRQSYFIPLMVRDVAAMLVATTHFLIPEGGA